MSVSGGLSDGLIRWTGKYDNISFRIKTPYSVLFDMLKSKLLCSEQLQLTFSASQDVTNVIKRRSRLGVWVGIVYI